MHTLDGPELVGTGPGAGGGGGPGGGGGGPPGGRSKIQAKHGGHILGSMVTGSFITMMKTSLVDSFNSGGYLL